MKARGIVSVRDVISVLDELAPPSLADSWDRAGLATGRPETEVSKVLVALTVTREAFAAARRTKAQMIVSHHPLIWEPLKTLRADDAEANLPLDVAQAGMACYSAHTNLDVVPGGVNDVLASRLGLTARAPLFPVPQARQLKLVTFVPPSHLAVVRDAVCEAGAGVIGDYAHCSFSTRGVGTFMPSGKAAPFSGKKHVVNEESEDRFETLVPVARLSGVLAALLEVHPYEEVAYDLVPLHNPDPTTSLGLRGELKKAMTLTSFAKFVCSSLNIAGVRTVGSPRKKVRTVAVLGGAGGSRAGDIPGGIDVYVTGDVTYHDALAARARGLAIVDAGHHGTEKWIVPALAEHLKARLKGLSVTTHTEPDVFRLVTE